jgi:O-antigen ligase
MNSHKASRTFIYATLLTIPLYLVRLTVWEIPTNILEVVVLFSFLFSFWNKNINFDGRIYQQIKIYFWPVSILLVGLLLSSFLNPHYKTELGIIKGWFIIPLLFSWALLREIDSREKIEKALYCLYFGTFLVGLAGLFYLWSKHLTYDLRLQAFYLSPNYLAMFLAPGIFIGKYFLESNLKILFGHCYQRIKPGLFFSFFSLTTILISFYFTYSYATWISVIGSLFLLELIRSGKKIFKSKYFFTIILLFAIFISFQINQKKFHSFFVPGEKSSLTSRIAIWRSSIRILMDNAIVGIGSGNFQEKYLEYQKFFPPYPDWAVPQPHNLYLAFWLQGGILGIFGFLLLIYLWLKSLVKIFLKQKNGFQPLLSVILGIIFYTLIHGLVDTPYWKNDLSLIFWTIFALGIIIMREKNKNASQSQSIQSSLF